MGSLYKSDRAKAEILALYDKKLESLGVDYAYRIVDTSFGKTNFIIAGDPQKPPLMLVHGSNGCAPIAIETYIDLLDSFSVYAIDVLAQPNKSAETRLSMQDESYGKWLNEAIEKLNLKDVTLAGFSFGGLVILKTLLTDESRIKEVFLTAPAFVVNGNPIKALMRFFIPMKRYMRTGNSKYLNQFLSSAFTEKDEFAYHSLALVFKYFEMDFTPVPVIKPRDAKKIQTPITLFAADNDILFPGRKMIKRAEKIFPSLKYALLLENSKHVQNKTDNARIAAYIVNSAI